VGVVGERMVNEYRAAGGQEEYLNVLISSQHNINVQRYVQLCSF
jgi:hypothetical protein